MEIKTWWQRLGCVCHTGANSDGEIARDEEIAELRAKIERQEQDALKIHRDLAAEKLRADQGWHRYEAANSRKNELEAERANWAQEIAALKAAQSVVAPMQPSPEIALPDLPSPASKWFGFPVADAKYFTVSQMIDAMREAQFIATSQPSIQTQEPGAEQLSRSKWTVKQWYEHVGAWENAQGEVCFGSVMALGAMLKLMAKARNFNAPMAHHGAVDAARLDWLNQNFFSDQKDEWDERQAPNSIKWKFFGPMSVQGNVRDVIDAAIVKEQQQ